LRGARQEKEQFRSTTKLSRRRSTDSRAAGDRTKNARSN
jgi:hypothetical protein